MFIYHNGESKIDTEAGFSSIMFKAVDNLVGDFYSTIFDVTFLALGGPDINEN